MQQHLKKLIFFSLFLCLIPFQTWASVNFNINLMDSGNFPTVKAIVNVEQDGVVLDNLRASSFKAAVEGGKSLSIDRVQSLEASGERVAMIVAVDASGSMKEKHLIAIKRAVKELINQKKQDDLVSLISFNDDVYTNCEFTTDSGKLLRKTDELKSGGKITVLFKAVYNAMEMFEKQNVNLPRLRYLVLLSDGKDEGQGFSLEMAVDKAKQLHIPIYSLGFLNKKKEHEFLGNMESMAALTGGKYQRVNSTKDLLRAYTSIANKILKQQVISMSAGFDGEGREHNLEIQYQAPNGEASIQRAAFISPLIERPPPPPETTPDTDKHDSSAIDEQDDDPIVEPDPSNTLLFLGVGIFTLLVLIGIMWARKNRAPKPVPLRSRTTPPPASPAPDTGPAQGQDPEIHPIENPLALSIPALGRVFPLTLRTMRIGAYSDNSLVLEAKTVSGYHAEISGNGKEWLLKDLGSTNGTRLNGERISRPTPLNKGDNIHIGSFEIHITSKS